MTESNFLVLILTATSPTSSNYDGREIIINKFESIQLTLLTTLFGTLYEKWQNCSHMLTEINEKSYNAMYLML